MRYEITLSCSLWFAGCGGDHRPPAAPTAPETEVVEESEATPRAKAAPDSEAPPESGAGDPAADAAVGGSLEEDLLVADEAFAEALSDGPPDCVAAERFRREVCRLSERICELSSPGSAGRSDPCEDGRRRCEQANRRFAEACG